jgi:hypothetical protein
MFTTVSILGKVKAILLKSKRELQAEINSFSRRFIYIIIIIIIIIIINWAV